MKEIIFNSKIGYISINESDDKIIALKILPSASEKQSTSQILNKAKKQILEYLDGKRKNFDLEIFVDKTEFINKVLKEVQNIEYGTTKSYKDIAKKVANEKYVRAVGMANNKNPIPIIIPCHRVVGSNNNLVGYFYGVELKQYLLELEKTIYSNKNIKFMLK